MVMPLQMLDTTRIVKVQKPRFLPATRKSSEFLIFFEARAPMATRPTKYNTIMIVPIKSKPITTGEPRSRAIVRWLRAQL
jgi:hypothetical protein